MKKIYLVLCCTFSILTLYAQQNEANVLINSGFFNFSGSSANKSSYFMKKFDYVCYTKNPYGNTPTLSYGLSFNYKRHLKSNIIFGIDFGYEILKSKVDINSIKPELTDAAEGKINLSQNILDIFPFVGYRINLNKNNKIDFTGFIEMANLFSSREKGNATLLSNSKVYYSDNRNDKINTDFKARIQAGFYQKNLGFYIGYSYGLSNYFKKIGEKPIQDI